MYNSSYISLFALNSILDVTFAYLFFHFVLEAPLSAKCLHQAAP